MATKPTKSGNRRWITARWVLVVMLTSLVTVAAYATIPGIIGEPILSGPMAAGGGDEPRDSYSREGPRDAAGGAGLRDSGRSPGILLQMNHQGVVAVNGQRFNGDADFRFALVDPGPPEAYLWTNDGSPVTPPDYPTNPVSLPVVDGLFNVTLGDTSLANMMAIPSFVFDDDNVALRIWFDDGTYGIQQLTPDHVLTGSPYAFHAAKADFATTAASGAGAIPGEIRMWAGPEATIPSGWLLCDGNAVSRTQYADLFAAVGASWGAGDGSTTFNLPDLRGRFVRGVDGATGRDPDAGSRTASNPGGNTGDNVGSIQAGATAPPSSEFVTNTTGEHSHDLAIAGSLTPVRTSLSVLQPWDYVEWTDTAGNHSHTVSGGGDNETRPINAYVHFIIKA